MRAALPGICLLLSIASFGQVFKFSPVSKEIVLQRYAHAPDSNQERAERIFQLFQSVGCSGANLVQQKIDGGPSVNVVCTLSGAGSEAIVVGAHYEQPAEGDPDDWSSAALLPSLYQSLKPHRRQHTIVFVAFSSAQGPRQGSRWFLQQLPPGQTHNLEAMVDLEALGLSPTKIWSQRSDVDLVRDFVTAMYSLKLPGSQIDLSGSLQTDSDSFMDNHIPGITLHSLTPDNFLGKKASDFRPNNYFQSYRLIAGYLAFLDQILKPPKDHGK